MYYVEKLLVEMVYCTQCGSKNSNVARICSQCGAALIAHSSVSQLIKINSEQAHRIISIGGLALGIIIILAGLIELLQQVNLIPLTIEVWPFAAIVIGSFLIIGVLPRIHRS
jgi:hypothetical protein